MEYYPLLLSTIFQTFGEGGPSTAVALISRDPVSSPAQLHPLEPFEFPSSLLPKAIIPTHLEGIDTFPATASTVVKKAGSRSCFAFPPQPPRFRSDEWRKRYASLDLLDALVVTMLDGEEALPRDRHGQPNWSFRENELLRPYTPELWSAGDARLECLILLIPSSALRSDRSDFWRQKYLPSHEATVIEHDHDGVAEALGLQVSPDIRWTTLILRPRPGPIRFMKITDEAQEIGAKTIAVDLTDLLRLTFGKTKFGFVHKGHLDRDLPCCFDSYSPETEKLLNVVSGLGKRMELHELVKIIDGCRPAFSNHSKAGVTDFLAVNSRNIGSNGRVDLSEVDTQERPAVIRHFLQDGDWCISRLAPDGGAMKVGEYRSDDREVTTAPGIILIRPNADLTNHQRRVLFNYLRSSLALRLLEVFDSAGSRNGRLQILRGLLGRLPVPLADPVTQTRPKQAWDWRRIDDWNAFFEDRFQTILRTVSDESACSSRCPHCTAPHHLRVHFIGDSNLTAFITGPEREAFHACWYGLLLVSQGLHTSFRRAHRAWELQVFCPLPVHEAGEGCIRVSPSRWMMRDVGIHPDVWEIFLAFFRQRILAEMKRLTGIFPDQLMKAIRKDRRRQREPLHWTEERLLGDDV